MFGNKEETKSEKKMKEIYEVKIEKLLHMMEGMIAYSKQITKLRGIV